MFLEAISGSLVLSMVVNTPHTWTWDTDTEARSRRPDGVGLFALLDAEQVLCRQVHVVCNRNGGQMRLKVDSEAGPSGRD